MLKSIVDFVKIHICLLLIRIINKRQYGKRSSKKKEKVRSIKQYEIGKIRDQIEVHLYRKGQTLK